MVVKTNGAKTDKVVAKAYEIVRSNMHHFEKSEKVKTKVFVKQ